MSRKLFWITILSYVCLCSLVICVMTGCQMDVGGHLGTKAFYPDTMGSKKLGDPRRPMYEQPGYTETAKMGGEVKDPSFRGMVVPSESHESRVREAKGGDQ